MSPKSGTGQKGPLFMMPQTATPSTQETDADKKEQHPVVYLQPVDDGLTLPKLLFMEKEWTWSSLIVNIVRTLGASLERDSEIDAVLPGQYMIDAFKRNLSLKSEKDGAILCEELAKLDLIMVRTDGVHENEMFEPEYEYSLVYHMKPHILNSVRFVRSGAAFEVDTVDEAVEQMQDVIVKLTNRMNRLKGFYSKLDDSGTLLTDWLLLSEDPQYLRFQELSCILQVICGSSEGSADSMLFKVAQQRPEFWRRFMIALYHLMVDHAMADLGTVATDAPTYTRWEFFTSVTYDLGGFLLSLRDIEHAILRGNQYPPPGELLRVMGKDDPRRGFTLNPVYADPRIHFLLSCGAKSCPPAVSIAKLSDDRWDSLAAEAAKSFVTDESNVKYDGDQNVLHLNKIFSWYKKDFGGTDALMLLNLRRYGGEDWKIGAEIADKTPKIKYMKYDWHPSASRIKTYSPAKSDSNAFKMISSYLKTSFGTPTARSRFAEIRQERRELEPEEKKAAEELQARMRKLEEENEKAREATARKFQLQVEHAKASPGGAVVVRPEEVGMASEKKAEDKKEVDGRHHHCGCLASPSLPSNITVEEGSVPLPDVLKSHTLPKPLEGVLKVQLAPAAVINLTANVGDIVEISLVGNPTTGYSWEDADRRWLTSNGGGIERRSLGAVRLVGGGAGRQVVSGKGPEEREGSSEILEYLAKVYKVNPHPVGYVGTGGIYYFYYQALRPGSCQLRFVYTRPWEHIPIPEQDCAGVNVVVHNRTTPPPPPPASAEGDSKWIVQLPEEEKGQASVTVLQQLSRLACSNLMQGLLGAISAVDGIRGQLVGLSPGEGGDICEGQGDEPDKDKLIGELIFLDQILTEHALSVSSLSEKVRILIEVSDDDRSSPSPTETPSRENIRPARTESQPAPAPKVGRNENGSTSDVADRSSPSQKLEELNHEDLAPIPLKNGDDNSPSSTVIVIDDEPEQEDHEPPHLDEPRQSEAPQEGEEPVRLSKAAKKRRRKARARQRQRAIMELVNREKAGEDLSEFEVDVLESFLNDEVPLPPSGLPPELLRMARELCEEWERQQMQQEDKLEEVEYFMMELANNRVAEEAGQQRQQDAQQPDKRQHPPQSSSSSSKRPPPVFPDPQQSTARLSANDKSIPTSSQVDTQRGIPVWNEWETLGQVAWKIEDMLEEIVPAVTRPDRPSGITDARPPRLRRAGSGEMKIEIRRTLRAVREGVDSLPVQPTANHRLLELRSVMDCIEDSMFAAGEQGGPSDPPRAVVEMLRSALEKTWPRSDAQIDFRTMIERQNPPSRRRGKRSAAPGAF
ncbi:hypothetical protein FOL47_001639 [Perkinsus chesapeaki]|uniref:Uncharacterized protein n=1 Tax=Perkinsus chesapeaki TaxID=330153 RepID=A0A7J6N1F1_PERCH|nr:hypothetical protein FOL47_001639 [Perkinsus chesapeaki]